MMAAGFIFGTGIGNVVSESTAKLIVNIVFWTSLFVVVYKIWRK